MFSIKNQEAWNPVSVFFLYNLGNITFHSGTKSPYLSNAFDQMICKVYSSLILCFCFFNQRKDSYKNTFCNELAGAPSKQRLWEGLPPGQGCKFPRPGRLLRLCNGPLKTGIFTHTQGPSFKRAVTGFMNSNRVSHFHADCFSSPLQTEVSQWAVGTSVLGVLFMAVFWFTLGLVHRVQLKMASAENTLVFQGKISKFLHVACQLQAYSPCPCYL